MIKYNKSNSCYETYSQNREILCLEKDANGVNNNPENKKVSESDQQKRVLVYPNPTQGKVRVELKEVCKGCMLFVFSSEGKELHKQKINDKIAEIDISNFESGIYELLVRGDSYSENFSIIKE